MEEVIDEWQDDTFPAMKEDYVNEELYYMRQNDLNDENKIVIDKEEG